ncbi:hypothetical protein ACHAXR_009467 [Thalassiosira sp. AJA248-18]
MPAAPEPVSPKRSKVVSNIQPPAEQAQPVLAESSSSKFGGSFGFGKKKNKSTNHSSSSSSAAAPIPSSPKKSRNNNYNNNDEERTAAPTPSPKKSSRNQPIDDDDSSDEDYKSSKRSSSCCSCKRLIASTTCLILLSIIGIILWRYGPWAKDSATVESLTTTETCNGCCNGLQSNCDLPVNEVLFPMVHNAHSSYDNNFVGASNSKPLEEALVAGYRALQLSTCLCEGFLSQLLLEQDVEWGLGDSNLGFCHTACGAGVRDPKDVLTNLKTFIESNPNEVLILQFEMNEGSSTDLRTALQYSGLLEYVYHPQDEYYIETWPTLQQLIDDNTRILLFGHGDGMKSCPAYDCDDGMLYTNDHFSQTYTDGSDIEYCDATISGDVFVGYFLMNHYETNKMKMPSPSKARTLNSYESLEARFEMCQGRRQPNLLAVEFWDEGGVLDFVKNENAGKNREGGEYDAPEDGENNEEEEEEEDVDNQGSLGNMGFGRGLRG